jgi:hypothetical protein
MPKKLKMHYRAADPRFTLCGKAVDDITGSPLNHDGSVPADREMTLTDTSTGVTCMTCCRALIACGGEIEKRK